MNTVKANWKAICAGAIVVFEYVAAHNEQVNGLLEVISGKLC